MSQAPEIAQMAESVEAFRAAEKQCPANKSHLGAKPCPKCGALSNESCRDTVRAAYAVVDAAKSALRTFSHLPTVAAEKADG